MKNKNIKRLDEISRRGFLKGLAGAAATSMVPGSMSGALAKELATPAGAAGRLSLVAAAALFQEIKDQLYQYDGNDDDEYYEAWSEMAGDLGFTWSDDDENWERDPTEELANLIDLYDRDAEAGTIALVKHLQTHKINPNNIGFEPRSDWRYDRRIDAGERLGRNAKGELQWFEPGDPGYPKDEDEDEMEPISRSSPQPVPDQAVKAAATTVARTQASPAVATSVAALKDLVQRVMSAGQTQAPAAPKATAPQALPAPDQSAAEIMAQLRDKLGRELNSQEQAVVKQELQKQTT